MKKSNLLTMLLSAAIIMSLIIITACTKEGPAGPAGEDGVDGNATCGTCHDNSETVETKILQWGGSIHATGGNYERNDTNCAVCHSSQGFKERLLTGKQVTAAKIQDPANINCYTCHMIHDTYSEADWDLRSTAPVVLWIDPSKTLDFGTGNLCVQCHQPRVATIPDVNTPDGIYNVTSTRWGPHHGPQSTVMTGNAFYLVGSGYSNSTHATSQDGCIQCHMAEAFGSQAGGHSFNITYDYHGSTEFNLNGCVSCHGTTADAEAAIEEFEPEFEALMTELGALLVTAGIYNPEGTSGTAVKGEFPNKVAGAYWNFITFEEDRSNGIHNPKFAIKILENTIASLQ